MRQNTWASVVLLALAACSSNPAPEPPAQQPAAVVAQTPAPRPTAFNPVGTFDFVTAVQGQELTGSIIITRNEQGVLGGRILTAMTGEMAITSVAVDGRKVALNASMPDATAITINVTFEDNDKFAGSWSAGGDSGNLSGKRKTN